MNRYYPFAKAIMAILLVVGVVSMIYYEVSPTMRLLREIKVGDSEQILINIIRSSKYVYLVRIYNRNNYKDSYYVSGWEYEKREIVNRVYICAISDKMVYYYIDKSGNVEYIFIGGS